MCHDSWMRREKRREERFDEELHYLLDEERRGFEPPAPVVEQQRDPAPVDPERVRVEAGLRS
jgi:Uma2 family endonuclease